MAAPAVDAFVRDGAGSLDEVMGEGFSHGFGAQEPNRRPVTFDVHSVEARRGGTFVFAHNAHLQRNPALWTMGETDVTWNGAGRIVAALVGGEEYFFVAGSLGHHGDLPQRETPPWDLTPPPETAPETAPETTPETPRPGADAVLHLTVGQAVR